MLLRHARTISMINRDRRTAFLLRDYFDLPRGITLVWSLAQRRLGQADLVLALLRLRDQRTSYSGVFSGYIELLVGHPISVGPSCLLRYHQNSSLPTVVRHDSADDRRLTFVQRDNPRQPRTEAHLRWCEFRVGRTVGQLRVRGVKRRDIRRAAAKGWIRLEERA